ncbi:ABC transporter ATP-binding protein [Variovorax sp. JS1663]|uniref:ABC transporter ATP-binding protein n=1 Tax=Variovorax sp. JS1663 TaxID=1851577 RepID=UPI000B348B23|nr:ABC transporter ATP-binding protein [Variovorax sp. JS1663]OUM02288.1 ABC transporter ATP-binding protein [Variovorax sp. JS1663]
MAESALLQVHGLGHSFGAVKVLSNVNLEVPHGGLVGLIGPNGSGKTTLFNLISGYIHPRVGEVRFEGRSMAGVPVEGRSRGGLVRTFQTPRVFESMTVLENIMAGCAKAGGAGMLAEMFALPGARRARREMQEAAGEVCARFKLWALRNEPTRTLPAGQRRVLEIARAVVGRPRLLMLDEPSSGLNDADVRALEHWIGQLRDDGIAVLLVSHDMDLMGVVDTVHLLYNGELLVSGDMSTLQADPRVRDVYLGA